MKKTSNGDGADESQNVGGTETVDTGTTENEIPPTTQPQPLVTTFQPVANSVEGAADEVPNTTDLDLSQTRADEQYPAPDGSETVLPNTGMTRRIAG